MQTTSSAMKNFLDSDNSSQTLTSTRLAFPVMIAIVRSVIAMHRNVQ